MEKFSVQLFPVARPDEWLAFCESAEKGDRAEAHREMLRRIRVTCEHIYGQTGPHGQMMVLVWEGIDQADVAGRMADMLQSPKTDHERYVATHVIPVIHGVDPAAGPPPQMQEVATIET